MSQRSIDRYDAELGLRVRVCGTCRVEKPITKFAGPNPNCGECRAAAPAELPAAEVTVPGPLELIECPEPEHVGLGLLPLAEFTKPNGERGEVCRPCWKRRWIKSRRTRANLRVPGVKR